MTGYHTAPTAMECVAAAVEEIVVAVTLAPPEPVVDPEEVVAASVPTTRATMPTMADDNIILFSSPSVCGCVEGGECLPKKRQFNQFEECRQKSLGEATVQGTDTEAYGQQVTKERDKVIDSRMSWMSEGSLDHPRNCTLEIKEH